MKYQNKVHSDVWSFTSSHCRTQNEFMHGGGQAEHTIGNLSLCELVGDHSVISVFIDRPCFPPLWRMAQITFLSRQSDFLSLTTISSTCGSVFCFICGPFQYRPINGGILLTLFNISQTFVDLRWLLVSCINNLKDLTITILELFEFCSLFLILDSNFRERYVTWKWLKVHVNLETFETLNRNTVIERIGHKVGKKPWNEIPDTTNRKKVTEHSRHSFHFNVLLVTYLRRHM